MKEHLRFLLALLLAGTLLFSCASKDEETSADELPAVEAAETTVVPAVVSEPVPEPEETPAAEAAGTDVVSAAVPEPEETPVLTPDVEEPEEQPVQEEPVSTEPVEEVEEQPVSEEPADDELLPQDEADLFAYDVLSAEYLENEFIPAEVKKDYILDVDCYYEGFSVSEDEFVAFEVPEPETEEEYTTPVESPVVEEEIPPSAAVPEKAVVVETLAPAIDPLPVPPVREDMKKPVTVIAEEAAPAVSENVPDDVSEELEEIIAAITESKPVPSRSVSVNRNDILEVPYLGNWWVYLGDENGSGALTFSSREYKSDKTVFTMRAAHEGVALLHFYKQDIIGGIMVDDYLEVNVAEAGGPSQKVVLDQFVISQLNPVSPETEESEEPSVENEAGSTLEKADAPVVQTTVKETERRIEKADAINYVQVSEEPAVVGVPAEPGQAAEVDAEENDAGGTGSETVVEMNDEQLFKRAQELEETDIESALGLYRKLVANYPASPYWNKANNRITYINRFYFFKR